ncbi:MAG: glycoside hydrolase family 3 C-terminal domain-containing protein [Firmicutes bacterium]|nr:glycoside hydrolase family 3 C-terminal domain-containing protein [Bacillota bacterium]
MKKVVKLGTLIATICTVMFGWIAGLYSAAAPIVLASESSINAALGITSVRNDGYWVDIPGTEGTFEPGTILPVPTAHYGTEYTTIANLKETSHKVSRDVQAEGSVLLMNENNALPLAANDMISLYDITSVIPIWGGVGSGQAYVTGASSGSDGAYGGATYAGTANYPTFPKALKAAGFRVNDDLWNAYNGRPASEKRANGSGSGWAGLPTIGGTAWNDIPGTSKNNACDAAIFVMGRIGGETVDRNIIDWSESTAAGNASKSYLQLSTKEQGVLGQLKAMRTATTIKKLILVINSSNPPELDWLTDNRYNFDAALWVGGIGQDGLDGIADILSGKTSPSGKLPYMYWNKHVDNPVYANFGSFDFGTGRMNTNEGTPANRYVTYQEGMYVGYRYAETRYEDIVLGTPNTGTFEYDKVVAYPFGYGGSYTNFEFSNYKVEKKDSTAKPFKTVNAINVKGGWEYRANDKERSISKTEYTVTVDVKNIGQTKSGKEVAQIYMQRPYGDYDKTNKIEKPSVELVGFAKTKVLAPGEVETLTITVDEKYFAAFDAYGAKTNVITAGDYYLAVGKDAHDALNNILAAKGKTTANGMTANGTAAFAHKITLEQNLTKYKYSDVTGREVTNLFNNADPNLYQAARGGGANDNRVEYISRSNWQGTAKFINPAVAVGSQNCSAVITRTTAMQADQNTNKAFVPRDDIAYPTMGKQNGANQIMLAEMATRGEDGKLIYGYDDPKWQDFLDQISWAEMVALLSNGVRRTGSIASVGKPTTLDHNGPVGFIHKYGDSGTSDFSGDKHAGFSGLSRIGIQKDASGNYVKGADGYYVPSSTPVLDPDRQAYPTAFPSNPILAATYNTELAEKVGDMIGEDGQWGGYNGIYGTGANLIRTPHQGRCFEYYSEDGFLAGYMIAYWSRGCQAKGVLVYNKHFALNEQELSRFGINTFLNEQAFRELYLRAFAIPIELGDARAIMGCLNRIGVEYGPACKALNTDWLRGEAGFQGHTVTDWWHDGIPERNADNENYYMQLSRTMIAGNDLPDGTIGTLKLNRHQPGGANVSGEVAWAMRESTHRICYSVADSWSVKGWTSVGGSYKGGTEGERYWVDVWVDVEGDAGWVNTVKAWQGPVWIPFALSAAAFVVFVVLGVLLKKGIMKG